MIMGVRGKRPIYRPTDWQRVKEKPMLPFEPGQGVVYRRQTQGRHWSANLLAYLREGTIYTVRSLEVHPSADGHPTLRLEEIRCPTINTSHIAWRLGERVCPRPISPCEVEHRSISRHSPVRTVRGDQRLDVSEALSLSDAAATLPCAFSLALSMPAARHRRKRPGGDSAAPGRLRSASELA
jgi:hypothetical protein